MKPTPIVMTSKDPMVSVVVPIFNSEKHLNTCIESLINQQFDDFEVLLINDGSTDNSLNICKKYSEEYDYIKILSKSNGGTSTAKNLGIRNAKGKWIVFVDSDDYVDKNYLSKLYSNVVKHDTDLVAAGLKIDYERDGLSIKLHVPENSIFRNKDNLKEGIYTLDYYALLNVNVSKIYRKEILKTNLIFFSDNLSTGEDLAFNCNYFQHINSMYLIADTPYHYVRRDEESLVNSYKKNLIDMVAQCNQSRQQLYSHFNMNEKKHKKLYARSYVDYMATCIPNLYRNNSNLNKVDREQQLKRIINDPQLQLYVNYYPTEKNLLTSFFLIMCKIKNKKIANNFYTLLFFLRYKFEGSYIKLRKTLLKSS